MATGCDVNLESLLAVAIAINVYAPSADGVHAIRYGLAATVPIGIEFAKKSTRVITAPAAVATACTVKLLGLLKSVPVNGEVISTSLPVNTGRAGCVTMKAVPATANAVARGAVVVLEATEYESTPDSSLCSPLSQANRSAICSAVSARSKTTMSSSKPRK